MERTFSRDYNQHDFEVELQKLLNRHSVDSYTGTHDFLLAKYLTKTIDLYRHVSMGVEHQLHH